ncbi:hypothetical protein C8F04DRAFT_1197146 [Mycena alexandri]|uniref:Uncharacterized protein n=1 Tax=Mycena alexandri TaxID=1745969 RepID=A0AAD6S2E0_9AGAR|nr:hypothetical protein C8F04DRAFT_1197146 [Mycena alexandri]
MGFFATESTLETQFAPALQSLAGCKSKHRNISERWLFPVRMSSRCRTVIVSSLVPISGTHTIHLGILHTFSASPNKVRKERKTDEDVPMPPSPRQTSAGADEDWADNPNDNENVEEGEASPEAAPNHGCPKEYPGFLHNLVFVILLTISMLAFARNRATNE